MMFGFGLGLGSKGVVTSSAEYLDSVLDSACMDLDATQSASYGGSGQTWANLIASPADGSNQTDFDFYLGADGTADATDPTFTGTAGDSGAYFAMDGGDYFELVSGTNPTLFADMAKTTAGNAWGLGVAFRTPSSITGGFYFFDTRFGAGSADGITLLWNNSAGAITLSQKQGGSATNYTLTGTSLSADTDYLLFVSYDKDTDKLRYWLNTTTGSEIAASFNAGTSDADDTPALGSAHGSLTMLNGTRVYGYYAGNAYLTNTDAGNLFTHLETRHGRDYTP